MAYLVVGFAAIWLVLALYTFWVAQQQADVARRVTDLEMEPRSQD